MRIKQLIVIALIIVILYLDWIKRREEGDKSTMYKWSNLIITLTITVIIMLQLLRGEQTAGFIYFQF